VPNPKSVLRASVESFLEDNPHATLDEIVAAVSHVIPPSAAVRKRRYARDQSAKKGNYQSKRQVTTSHEIHVGKRSITVETLKNAERHGSIIRNGDGTYTRVKLEDA
jgi:hypothetical protein